MSLWTDIRDTITAPARIIGGFAADVINGKNIFEGTADLVKGALAVAQGPVQLAFSSAPVKAGLNALSPLTLGVSGQVASNAEIQTRIIRGEDVSGEEYRKNLMGEAKSGAIVGAAILTGGIAAPAASGGISALQVGAGFAGANAAKGFLQTGDPSKLMAGVGSFLGSPIPQEFMDAFQAAKNAAKSDPEVHYYGPPQVDGGFSLQSGYDSAVKPDRSLEIAAAAALALVVIAKVRRG